MILGRGSFTESYPLFGHDLHDYDLLFEERLELFVRLLRQDRVTWAGQTRAPLKDARVYPPLGPNGLIAWIGVGGSPESVVRAVRHDMPMMLAVIGGSAIGMTSLVFYVLVYMAANLAVFGVLSAVEQHSGGRVSLEDYNGFSRTNPRLALLMTLALFSLAGIPPFAGFFSKFFVFAAAFSGGFHLLVFIALVNTVVSLYYYLLVVKAMYITPNEEPIAPLRSDRYTRISLALCMAGVLLLGVFSVVYDSINVFSFGL